MTDPYDGPRDAVAAWAAGSAPADGGAGARPAAGPSAGGGAVGPDSQPGVFDPQRGALVAAFPAVGYDRLLDWLSVKCSYSGLVEVFTSTVDELGRITSWPDGSFAEFDPNRPRFVPGGAALYVVWTVPDSTHTATAKAGMRGAA